MNRKKSTLKIGYFADGPWSHKTFDLLAADKTIDIRFVIPRCDTKDDTLKNLASEHGIDYFTSENINSPDFLKKIAVYGCDIFVSMSFNQIFRKEIINLPPMKTINCHAGKLPFYRGRNILNWALINDEKEFGITVHYMDEGVDTGDIILQRTYPITDRDDYNMLLNRAYTNCAEILYDAVKLLQSGKAKRIKQSSIHPVGFYCGMRKAGDEILNWQQTSREIFNFIRAICKPGPMARTMLNGKELKINKAKMIKKAPAYKLVPGMVVGKNGNSLFVKTMDTAIEITEYEYDGKIRVGDRLG